MVGDGLIDDPPMSATRAISIAAPPAAVFPWLVQMGYGRAGWYSYDWIDNLGRRSADELIPEWQSVGLGDPIPGGPIDFTAAVVQPPAADPVGRFVIDYRNRLIEFTLAYETRPTADGGTRLVSRARARVAGPLGAILARLLAWGDGVMVRRQLRNLKARAEGAAATIA
jgi:hypothetical protein